MKYLKILFYSFFLPVLPASAVQVTFDYRIFHLPGEGPYVEVITSLLTSDLTPGVAADGSAEVAAELTLIFSQNNTVVDFRKVRLSGSMESSDNGPLISLERFALPNGEYDFELSARDTYNSSDPIKPYFQKILIDNLSKGAFISDIELVSAFTPTTEVNAFSKSGYDIIPYLSSFFPTELKTLVFYTEFYQTDNYFGVGEPFVSSVCITDPLNNEVAECKRIRREKAAAVVPVLQSIDIQNLPTGDYKLRVEIRDRNNEVVASKERRFSRNLVAETAADPLLVGDDVLRSSFVAQYTNADTLYGILQSHLPIAQNVERNTIDYQLDGADLRMLQSFFYSFWQRRNPADPESAWRAYEKEVNLAQQNFGTRIRKGWQTDRGRVYLQYGPPSTRVIRNHDPDYWPFEIWHYYETNTGLHDRRFLFYNTSLDGNMELLHTDIANEIQNNDWRRLVRSREGNTPGAIGRNASNQMVDPYSGDELQDLWYNPH